MQRESAIVSAYSADRDSGRESRLWWRRLILGVLMAWTIPALLHVIRLDLAVWLLLLVGTGSLLRSGAALLDRLFLAGVILAGGLLTAGLLFSVWPWGLAPVPVGGTLLSLLVVIACLTRRIPRLPLRVGWSDGAIVGSGLATFAAIYHPLLGLSLTHRLMYSTTQLDRLAHFALFQTIGRVSGYAFLHQSEARISVQTPTEYVYPQGSHFLLAVIDAFSRLSGSPVGNYDRYFVYVLVAFAMLVACIVWAARWIAGPGLGEGWRIAICCGTAAFALFGVLPGLLRQGFDSEVFGLVFVALAAAVVVRPLRSVREQLVVVSALAISVFYTYNIFGVMVGLAIALSLGVYRIPSRQEWRFAGILLAAAGVIAILPSALAVLEGFDAHAQSLAGSGGIELSGLLVLFLALVVLLPALYQPARRDPVWRGIGAQFLAVGLIVGLFGVYQRWQIGGMGYYYEKLLTAAYVTVMACLGTVGVAIRAAATSSVNRRSRDGRPADARHWQAIAGPWLALMLTLGFLQHSVDPGTEGSRLPTFSPLIQWTDGRYRSAIATPVISLAQAGLLGDGIASIPVYSTSSKLTWTLGFFMASYNRDLGLMQAPLEPLKSTVTKPKSGASPSLDQQLAPVVAAVRNSPVPLRLIVRDSRSERDLRSALAANHLSATIVIGPKF
jgi:hypothetical protein